MTEISKVCGGTNSVSKHIKVVPFKMKVRVRGKTKIKRPMHADGHSLGSAQGAFVI